jgi:hypothetical protein
MGTETLSAAKDDIEDKPRSASVNAYEGNSGSPAGARGVLVKYPSFSVPPQAARGEDLNRVPTLLPYRFPSLQQNTPV